MQSWLARKLTLPIYLIDFLRRTPNALALVVASFLFWFFFPSLFVAAISLGARLAFALVFMVVQFMGLFYFLASGKTVTILPGDPKQVTMKDYYGQESLKKTLSQWLQLLQDPSQLKAMGGEAVRGILLSGEPGVGKSWLAKCIAGEIDIPFIGTDGSSFTSMFMGIGVIKVIRLWAKARSLARRFKCCILFIDEIDAL